MITKCKNAEINLTNCTNMLLNGAKKRRAYAICAVKTLNAETGIKTNIALVK